MAEYAERHHFREPNLAPTETARQHFVPRFYLANFADGGVIEACDLENGREFRASVEDVAVRRGFGDLEVGGQALSTETWLAYLETAAAPVLRRLAAEPATVLALSPAEEHDLSRFIAAQRFRVPAFRTFEQRMAGSLVEQVKEFARRWLYNTEPRDEADEIWAVWEAKPDWWWLQQNGPVGNARDAAIMLGEVQGFANLARAMPWRAGWVNSRSHLYTSDNPMSGYLPPVRPWWSGAGFADHAFFLPLSTRALLLIGSTGQRASLQPRGERRCQDFSLWETAFARHVVTAEAERFLYGPGPYVSKECADSCLGRLGEARLCDAMLLQGFDPRPPSVSVA